MDTPGAPGAPEPWAPGAPGAPEPGLSANAMPAGASSSAPDVSPVAATVFMVIFMVFLSCPRTFGAVHLGGYASLAWG